MRPLWYILDGTTPVPSDDQQAAAAFFNSDKRCVARTQVGRFRVSTVFLCLDHGFNPDRPPVLFETMIFDDAASSESCHQRRYTTWAEAEQGHAEWCHRLRTLGPWWPPTKAHVDAPLT